MIAPPGGRAAAEDAACEQRIATRSRHDVEDAYFQNVSGLGVFDRDRAGADMNAEPFAGAAAEDRRVHGSGAAPVDAFGLPGPKKHAFRAGVAGDHPCRIVGGMLGQGLDRDRVAGDDLDDRLECAAEKSPMHMGGIDRQMMVLRPRPLRRRWVADACCRRGGDDGLRPAFRPSRAQLRERLLGPAALAMRAGRRRGAFGFLPAKFPRRQAEPLAKGPAEMRRVVEAAAEGDLRHRLTGLGRIGELRERALQATFAQVAGEVIAGAFEQLLQIALGDAFGPRHARRCERRIVQPVLDGLIDALEQRRLGGRSARLGTAGRRRMHQRQHQFGKALVEGRPFRRRERLQRIGRRFQRPRQHGRQSLGGKDARLGEGQRADLATEECAAGHREGDRLHFRLEQQLPAALARKDDEIAGRQWLPRPGGLQCRAGFEREEDERQVRLLRQGRDRLRAGGNTADDHAVGRAAPRGHGMQAVRGRQRGRAQTKGAKDVLPSRLTVGGRIGLAGEPAETHASTPCGTKQQPCQNFRASNRP